MPPLPLGIPPGRYQTFSNSSDRITNQVAMIHSSCGLSTCSKQKIQPCKLMVLAALSQVDIDENYWLPSSTHETACYSCHNFINCATIQYNASRCFVTFLYLTSHIIVWFCFNLSLETEATLFGL